MPLLAQIKNSLLSYPTLFPSREHVLAHMFFVLGNGYQWVDGELVDPYAEQRTTMDYSSCEPTNWGDRMSADLRARLEESDAPKKAAQRAEFEAREANIDKLAMFNASPYFGGFLAKDGHYSQPHVIVDLTYKGYLFNFPADAKEEYVLAAADLLERLIQVYRSDNITMYALAYIRHKVLSGHTLGLKGSLRLSPQWLERTKLTYDYSMPANAVLAKYGAKEHSLSSNGSGTERVSTPFKLTDKQLEKAAQKLQALGYIRKGLRSWKAFNTRLDIVEYEGEFVAINTVIHVHPGSYNFATVHRAPGRYSRRGNDTGFMRATVKRARVALTDPFPVYTIGYANF